LYLHKHSSLYCLAEYFHVIPTVYRKKKGERMKLVAFFALAVATVSSKPADTLLGMGSSGGAHIAANGNIAAEPVSTGAQASVNLPQVGSGATGWQWANGANGGAVGANGANGGAAAPVSTGGASDATNGANGGAAVPVSTGGASDATNANCLNVLALSDAEKGAIKETFKTVSVTCQVGVNGETKVQRRNTIASAIFPLLTQSQVTCLQANKDEVKTNCHAHTGGDRSLCRALRAALYGDDTDSDGTV
jgi:hypothetical protein